MCGRDEVEVADGLSGLESRPSFIAVKSLG